MSGEVVDVVDDDATVVGMVAFCRRMGVCSVNPITVGAMQDAESSNSSDWEIFMCLFGARIFVCIYLIVSQKTKSCVEQDLLMVGVLLFLLVLWRSSSSQSWLVWLIPPIVLRSSHPSEHSRVHLPAECSVRMGNSDFRSCVQIGIVIVGRVGRKNEVACFIAWYLGIFSVSTEKPWRTPPWSCCRRPIKRSRKTRTHAHTYIQAEKYFVSSTFQLELWLGLFQFVFWVCAVPSLCFLDSVFWILPTAAAAPCRSW